MRIEIERKFLVVSDAWRNDIVSLHRLRDGLVSQTDRGKVRVRIDGDQAWLTVKGIRSGIARPEYEYEIPREDAEDLLRNVCSGRMIEKTRFCVGVRDALWTVDVFEGRLEGIVWAEIELADEDQPVIGPAWLGAEVTADPRFRQSNLLALTSTGEGPITLAKLLASGEHGKAPHHHVPPPERPLHPR